MLRRRLCLADEAARVLNISGSLPKPSSEPGSWLSSPSFLANSDRMFDMNDIRVGSLVKIDGQPYICLWSDFMRTAQRKPVRRTKLKNLITGNVLEQTFKHGDKIEEADVERSKASYLYSDDTGAHFMDNESFEQVTLPKEMVA